MCIDLKSFYASVECALLGLDPFKTPLVVADHSRGGGSIVLAVSPYLKKFGVPGRCRIFELPTNIKIIFQKPRMEKYLEYSTKIVEIYLRFVSEEDMYVYSIDEVFLDLTEYMNFYKKTDVQIAKMIMAEIYKETKVYSTCGIGPNMLMAKLALDIESKHSPDFIAKWDYENLPEKLWKVTPLSEMWGIGRNMEAHLNKMGLFKIGDIANFDVKRLKRKFGIIGEELYYHTHGIDSSLIQDKNNIKPIAKSYGTGQTLFRDYFPPDVYQIVLELVDDVSRRLRMSKKKAKTIHFGIGYSKEAGGGFSRQLSLDQPTSSESEIYKACLHLFNQYYEREPIRRVHVSVTNLVEQPEMQINLFEDINQAIKEAEVFSAIDEIKFKYGKNAVNRASSELKASTVKARNDMIGGHNA
ncbi:MAG: damage repair protein [Tenericutes bacterium HGW-Tenericutes-1]|jgi:DNA polymerase V|nr:MAG: damage repair protein [Tenericutes bacterium HGW-Tenericutes-1]